MSKYKHLITYMFYLFCFIVTAQAVFFGLFASLPVDAGTLRTILLSALAGVIPLLMTAGMSNVGKNKYYLLLAAHLLITTLSVFGVLHLRGALHSGNFVSALALFLIIYFTVTIRNEIHYNKDAKKLNKRISEQLNEK